MFSDFGLFILFYCYFNMEAYDLFQLEQKQKYAAWKAADIRKALKEGRKPNAGPPSGDDDLSVPSSTNSDAYVWFLT